MRARHALFLVVAALACVATVSIGSATASPRAAADQSWTDPAGDAVAGAPDMTAVSVSNDEAGTITITVTVPLNDGSMIVFLDTNQNGSFSDPTDKMTGAFGLGSGLAVGIIFKSNPLTAKVNATATTVTFVFPKAEAGIGEGFGFWILSQSAAQFGSDQAGDMFPDGTGVLTYTPVQAAASSATAPPASGYATRGSGHSDHRRPERDASEGDCGEANGGHLPGHAQ